LTLYRDGARPGFTVRPFSWFCAAVIRMILVHADPETSDFSQAKALAARLRPVPRPGADRGDLPKPAELANQSPCSRT
jgi:hypothetical protein